MIDAVLKLEPKFDILIVDDNSPDGTADLAKAKIGESEGRLHVLDRPGKQGLGTAYIAGFHWCLERNYPYVFEMDCDFSHNPTDLVRLHAELEQGNGDMVIGSRYVNNVVNVVNWPMGRVLLSYFASSYVRFITRMKIADATAGFVGYTNKVLQTINLDKIKFKGYAFQIEMKYTATRLGFKLKEIPIIFTDRTLGESKMSSGIIREALIGVIQMRFRKYRPRQ